MPLVRINTTPQGAATGKLFYTDKPNESADGDGLAPRSIDVNQAAYIPEEMVERFNSSKCAEVITKAEVEKYKLTIVNKEIRNRSNKNEKSGSK